MRLVLLLKHIASVHAQLAEFSRNTTRPGQIGRAGVGFRLGQARRSARRDARGNQAGVFRRHLAAGVAPLGAEDGRDAAEADHVLQDLAGLSGIHDPDTWASLSGCDVVACV